MTRIVEGPARGRAGDRERAEHAHAACRARAERQHRPAEHHAGDRGRHATADRLAVKRPGQRDGEHGFEVEQQRTGRRPGVLQAPCEQGRREPRADHADRDEAWNVAAADSRTGQSNERATTGRGQRRARVQQGRGGQRPDAATGPRHERGREPERERGERGQHDTGRHHATAFASRHLSTISAVTFGDVNLAEPCTRLA
jgi:hypothetical protein